MYYDGSQIKSVDYSSGRTARDVITFAMDKAKSLAFKRIGQKSGGSSGSSGGGSGTFRLLPLHVYSCFRCSLLTQRTSVVILNTTTSFLVKFIPCHFRGLSAAVDEQCRPLVVYLEIPLQNTHYGMQR